MDTIGIETETGDIPGLSFGERKIMSNENSTETTATTTETKAAKGKKTRTVDYTRTDKKPHSFRYKRGSAFTARAGAIALAKESDGALVIGPLPTGVEAQADAEKFETGTLKLVSVKKRPNGKCAITFESDTGAQVIAYDARAARAALRSA
jgi:hypothetical protein